MDYLIISDAHGDRQILEDVVNHYRGKVKAMFYNGDSELSRSDELFNDLLPPCPLSVAMGISFMS